MNCIQSRFVKRRDRVPWSATRLKVCDDIAQVSWTWTTVSRCVSLTDRKHSGTLGRPLVGEAAKAAEERCSSVVHEAP